MNATDHRDAAAQLLADVNEADAPSEARVLTQAAIAHALLGLLEIQLAKGDMTGRAHRQSAGLYGITQPICHHTGTSCYPICPDCVIKPQLPEGN